MHSLSKEAYRGGVETVLNQAIANSQCFLKMYRVDFVQKFLDNSFLCPIMEGGG